MDIDVLLITSVNIINLMIVLNRIIIYTRKNEHIRGKYTINSKH